MLFERSIEFTKRLKLLKTWADIEQETSEFLNVLGFQHFACCSHVQKTAYADGVVLLFDYPVDWVHLYAEKELLLRDPVVDVVSKSMMPFFWQSEDFTRNISCEQRWMLSEAARFGLEHGLTIPIHVPGHNLASFSAAGPADAMTEENMQLVQMIAPYVYNRAYVVSAVHQEIPILAPLNEQERAILTLVGQGKSDWVIAQIAGMSQRSVTRRIERIRARFDVATRMQAVAKALSQGHISFDDVLETKVDGPGLVSNLSRG